MDDFREPKLTMILLGDTGVGKSNIFLRFIRDEFADDHLPTVGIDFDFKQVVVCN